MPHRQALRYSINELKNLIDESDSPLAKAMKHHYEELECSVLERDADFIEAFTKKEETDDCK